MNNNIEILAKVDHISKEMQEKKNKEVSTTKLYAIVYGVLVLFVFGYTTFIFTKLKEVTTPDSISAVVTNKIKDSLPDLNKAILDQTKKNAPVLAEKAVEAVHQVIPQVETVIKDVIDENGKRLVVQIKSELFPQFLKILRDNAKPVNEASAFTDENTAKELAKTLCKEIEDEINYNIICNDLCHQMDSLRAELEKIVSKPINQLTAKELAERRIIVKWIYLLKKGESLQSITATFVSRFSGIWDNLIDSAIPSEDSKDDTISD